MKNEAAALLCFLLSFILLWSLKIDALDVAWSMFVCASCYIFVRLPRIPLCFYFIQFIKFKMIFTPLVSFGVTYIIHNILSSFGMPSSNVNNFHLARDFLPTFKSECNDNLIYFQCLRYYLIINLGKIIIK